VMFATIIRDEIFFARTNLGMTALILGLCAAMAVLVVFTG